MEEAGRLVESLRRVPPQPDPELDQLAHYYRATWRARLYEAPYYWAAFAFSGAEV